MSNAFQKLYHHQHEFLIDHSFQTCPADQATGQTGYVTGQADHVIGQDDLVTGQAYYMTGQVVTGH